MNNFKHTWKVPEFSNEKKTSCIMFNRCYRYLVCPINDLCISQKTVKTGGKLGKIF